MKIDSFLFPSRSLSIPLSSFTTSPTPLLVFVPAFYPFVLSSFPDTAARISHSRLEIFTSNSAKKMSPVSSLPTGTFYSVEGISNLGHNGSTFFASGEGLDPKMFFIGKQQNSIHFKLCFDQYNVA